MKIIKYKLDFQSFFNDIILDINNGHQSTFNKPVSFCSLEDFYEKYSKVIVQFIQENNKIGNLKFSQSFVHNLKKGEAINEHISTFSTANNECFVLMHILTDCNHPTIYYKENEEKHFIETAPNDVLIINANILHGIDPSDDDQSRVIAMINFYLEK